MLDYKTTKDIKVSQRIVDQVIGQEEAINVIKKAALQRRHVLLIGEPGTGKSMIGMALAELLQKENIPDILCLSNEQDENIPLIRTMPKGKGKELINKLKLQSKTSFKTQNIIFFILVIFAVISPWWVRKQYGDIMAAASLISSMVFLATFVIFINLSKRFTETKFKIPKLLIDNSEKKQAPFLDATGAHAGALLGDVLHDPLQSGGLGTPAHERVICMLPDGTIHLKSGELIKAEKFIGNYFLDNNYIIEGGIEKVYLSKNEEIRVLGEKSGSVVPSKVYCVMRRKFKGKIINIITNNGNKIRLTPNHPIAIIRDANIIYKPIGELNKDDFITFLGNDKVKYNNFKLPLIEKSKIYNAINLDLVKEVKSEDYEGYVYNLTTETNNYFTDKILVHNCGMIHRANKGVLFIDEIANLKPESQQELLTAIQEKKYSITGQSERSAGAMVRTEQVPCDFVLVAAGNIETVKRLHPALRSRIKGYGYEVYMNELMEDNQENRDKLVVFIAQEVNKDKKIPHFTREAVEEIIKEAKKYSGVGGKLTVRLRELGGIVRAAGDIAKEENSEFTLPTHIKKALKFSRPLEKQITDRYIEHKKKYEVIITQGKKIGRVNGLAVMGYGAMYSGLVLPIESEVTPGGKKAEFIATGKLGNMAREAIKNVSAIILKSFGEDIKEKYDIYVQFLQTGSEGVEGDSASIAVATAIISALKKIPIRQDTALTGSLSIRGEVLAVGGVTAKTEAAIEAGLKQIIIPKSNEQDLLLSKEQKSKIKVIPVTNIKDVLQHALSWEPKQKKILNKIKVE